MMKSTENFKLDRSSPGLIRLPLLLRTQSGSVECSMGWEMGVRRGFVSLRIGSVNVMTMRVQDGEVVSMATECLDCC